LRPLQLENLPLTPHFAPPTFGNLPIYTAKFVQILTSNLILRALVICARGRPPSTCPLITPLITPKKFCRVEHISFSALTKTWKQLFFLAVQGSGTLLSNLEEALYKSP